MAVVMAAVDMDMVMVAATVVAVGTHMAVDMVMVAGSTLTAVGTVMVAGSTLITAAVASTTIVAVGSTMPTKAVATAITTGPDTMGTIALTAITAGMAGRILVTAIMVAGAVGSTGGL